MSRDLVKFDDLVRDPATRKLTTLPALAREGRLTMREVANFAPSRRTKQQTAWFADIADGNGWRVTSVTFIHLKQLADEAGKS